MEYFYDTEFIEDGKTIDLISIGIVSSDGREYYAQSCEYDPRKANDWVRENVLRHIVFCPNYSDLTDSQPFLHYRNGQCLNADYSLLNECPWRTRNRIHHEIVAFLDPDQYGKPELWGYYSAYDHVAFCQLFGTMMDLPKGFPMYTKDLKQWCDELGSPELPKQEVTEHNALEDARWNKSVYDFLMVTEGMQYLKMQRQWKESRGCYSDMGEL
jgi:hypothetical protein